jgi:hypothetical protein
MELRNGLVCNRQACRHSQPAAPPGKRPSPCAGHTPRAKQLDARLLIVRCIIRYATDQERLVALSWQMVKSGYISARSIPGLEQLTACHGHPCDRTGDVCGRCEPIGKRERNFPGEEESVVNTSTKINSRFPELFLKRNNDSHLSPAPWHVI